MYSMDAPNALYSVTCDSCTAKLSSSLGNPVRRSTEEDLRRYLSWAGWKETRNGFHECDSCRATRRARRLRGLAATVARILRLRKRP
jgi:hypothetical protein